MIYSETFARQFLLTCLLGLIPACLFAQSAVSGDHPLFSRFPDSEIVSVDFDEDTNYRLVLSGLQRTRGLVTPETSKRLRADVTKIVYEVSQEFTGADVYQYFREQMLARGYAELFTCAGRGCGSSNYWANDIFRNRILYGPERNQYYLAMRAGNELDQSPHIALYIITRGNRKIYAYLEIIEVGGARARLDRFDSNRLLEDLQEQGALVIPDISFSADDALSPDSDLQPIVELLRTAPQLQIYIVAHLAGDEELPVLLNRSQLRAQYLRQRLMELGIDGVRMDAQGVGPLAPTCVGSDCENRVEIVLQ